MPEIKDVTKRNYQKILREIDPAEFPSIFQDKYICDVREKLLKKQSLLFSEEQICFHRFKKYIEEYKQEVNRYYVQKTDFSKFSHRPPLSFQEDGIKFLLSNDRCILADDTGCIEGEQIVHCNLNGNCHFKVPIRELYLRFNNLKKQSLRWQNRTYYASCLLPDGRFYLREIEQVVFKGVKRIFKIFLEDGKTIECTNDHLFNNNGSWKPLSKLNIGDEIYVNGKQVCLHCGDDKNLITHKYSKYVGYCKTCMYRIFRTNKHRTIIGSEFVEETGHTYIMGFLKFHPKGGGVYKHRLVYEAYLNGYTYDEYLKALKYNKLKENHIFLTPDQLIHHIDENPRNNDISNLQLVTHAEHSRIHKKRKNIKKVLAKSIKISNIIDLNVEKEVFDMTVKDAHNYIVNGIVVHNCGKSIEAILAVLLLQEDYKILLVTTKSLKYNFQKEISYYCDSYKVIEKKWETGYKFTIVNYDSLKKWSKEIEGEKFDCIIADEAHYLINTKSARSQNFKKIAGYKSIKKLWLLTGTPITNRPFNYFNLLKLIKHPLSKNWVKFVETYCNGSKDYFGKWITDGSSNEQELHDKTKDVVLRRLKKDHVKDLPNKDRQPIFLHMDNWKGYNQTVKDYEEKKLNELKSSLDDSSMDELFEEGIETTAMTKLILWRKFCALEKIRDGSLVELITNQIDQGNKVVVFTNFTSVVDAVYNHFGEGICRMIDGRVSDPLKRLEIVDEFNSNLSLKLFVLNMQVGSVGLNIQSANVAIINDMYWVPGTMLQAEDRLWRIGQEREVTILYPIYEKTVEAIVYEVIDKKMKIISSIVEGKKESYFGMPEIEKENNRKSILADIFSQLN